MQAANICRTLESAGPSVRSGGRRKSGDEDVGEAPQAAPSQRAAAGEGVERTSWA